MFFIATGILTRFFPEIDTTIYQQTGLNELFDESPLLFVILTCLFAPVVEEMMFRTLVAPSHSDLILFLSAWPAFIVWNFIPGDIHWSIKLLFIAILLFSFYYILKQLLPEDRLSRIQVFLHRYTYAILIITSLLFGLLHISNYVDEFTINIALFLLIVPRILSGYMMGMLKLKNKSLPWSMGLHFLNNGAVVLMFFLISK